MVRHIVDDTLLQFGRAVGSGPRASSGPRPLRGATTCPRCAQHFSPDGRFCPFDGEPLLAAPGWDPSSDPLLGTIVEGRYEIRSVLGEGGMGIVYEARHCALGKRFALKALRKELSRDADIAARFEQEARTAAAVSHPGLVEITDFGQLATGQPFFVMELLEGQPLAELIRRGGPIPAERAIDIVRQLADALTAAHDHSIVHRDLKPDNIHISPAGPGRDRVTIVDFGLAKVLGTSRLTRAGMVFGTPHYMSPEQAMGEATDHRADIYALGIVMYEMFTGRVPFEADSYMGVLTKHMYMAPTPPSQLVATAELGVLEDITLRCLEKKPERRYASLRELTHDLNLALNGRDREAPSIFRQRRAVPRSVLADELELPGPDERSSWSRRAPQLGQPRWPLLVVGGLFLSGIGGVLALRLATTRAAVSPVLQASSRGASPAMPEKVTRVPAAPAVASAPLPMTVAMNTVPSAPAASAPPRARAALGGEAPLSPPKRAKTMAAGPAAPGSVGTPTPKKPTQAASAEIVDPWAK